MRVRSAYNKSLFLLVPLLAASVLFFVLSLSGMLNMNEQPGKGLSSEQGTTIKMKEQKQELPDDHDLVLSPIFKFIVNCNPFKKESSF